MFWFKSLFPQALKNSYHFVQAIVANVWYGFPSKKLKVIGVTGTDGKTTVTQLVVKILEEGGYKVAMASTINFKVDQKEWVNTSKYTTLDAFATQKFLRRAQREGCEYVVLEVGSHALDQYRVWGIEYEVAVITNVTREHLDYHKTMERYRKAKKKLFKNAKIAVVNADMENPNEFTERKYERVITYGIESTLADLKAENIVVDANGSTFTVKGQLFSLLLPGAFNIENALAAIGVGEALNIPLKRMAIALEKVTGVAGRMEKVANNRGITILIDYAVTPNALQKLYQTVLRMKTSPNAKIIAVFGACGDRDRGKRPLMGKIVSSFADTIILTNEDPYFEDPHRIVREVSVGIANKKRGKNLFVLMNRRKAIARALMLAIPGDIVVITGKGAEETMAIGKKRLPWNDKREIETLLTK